MEVRTHLDQLHPRVSNQTPDFTTPIDAMKVVLAQMNWGYDEMVIVGGYDEMVGVAILRQNELDDGSRAHGDDPGGGDKSGGTARWNTR